MLSIIDKPRTIRQEVNPQRGSVAVKIAYFFGNNKFIDDVIKKRRSDKTCRQLPSREENVGRYHVKVTYCFGGSGILVHRIDVRFESANWSCFYDSSSRKGTLEFCDGNFRKHFLLSDECVNEYILRYEDALAVTRLSNLGPDAFPKRRVE